MQIMTLERWVELLVHLFIYSFVLFVVREYVVWKIRGEAIDMIHQICVESIDSGDVYDDSIWERYGLIGSRRKQVLNRQFISLHKWNFEDFYPDLAKRMEKR